MANTDATHLPVFHQVDGIVIDENASFAALAQASVESGSEMSVRTNTASPFPARDSIADAARSSLSSATTTFAPSARNRSA
jgi:hypothetical protein